MDLRRSTRPVFGVVLLIKLDREWYHPPDFLRHDFAYARIRGRADGHLHDRAGLPRLGLGVKSDSFGVAGSYLTSTPQGSHGKHRYKRASDDEAIASDERRKYRRYQDYFNVPNEA